MVADDLDEVWEAVVEVMLPLGCVEKRSRYADKPALVLGSRELAHTEAPGTVDLRITAAGWRAAAVADPCVERDPNRRDWIVLRLDLADVPRLTPLLTAAVAANR